MNVKKRLCSVRRTSLLILVVGMSVGRLADAATVFIDGGGASGWGCTPCSGGPPGVTNRPTLVNYNKATPLQLTLGPGIYEITNASQSLGTYSAVRFNGGPNWAWNYVMGADNGDGTATVVKIGYMLHNINGSPSSGVLPSPQDWQDNTDVNSYYWDPVTGAQLVQSNIKTTEYRDTFSLTKTTTLDFFFIDYHLPDNAGGIALNIKPVPVPAAALLFSSALGSIGIFGRRRTRSNRASHVDGGFGRAINPT